MTTELKKERLHYIDQLKGIAIFLVVVGHIIQFNCKDFSNNPIFSIIYSFHMPLFMFISGYVAFKSMKATIFNSYFQFLMKRIRTILLPFLSWQLLISPFFFKDNTSQNPILRFINLSTHIGMGLWFLWFLFLLTLLYSLFLFISNRVNKNNNFIVDVVFAGIVLIPVVLAGYFHLISYANSLALYFLFFFLGIFISKFSFLKNLILNNIVFSISIFTFLLLSRSYYFGDESSKNLLIKMILSNAAIFSLYNIVNKITWNAFIDKTIQQWGKNSLIIYVTHFPLVFLVSRPQVIPYLELLPMLVITTAAAFIIIITCIGIAKLVATNSILDLLMYGRKNDTTSDKGHITQQQTS